MARFLFLAVVLLFGFGALVVAQASRNKRLALYRVAVLTTGGSDAGADFQGEAETIATFPPRYRYAPLVGGVLIAGLILAATSFPAPYAVGAAVLTASLLNLMEVLWADRRIALIENQLADSIDLMVASLRAGSALLGALDATLEEAPSPIKEELEQVVGRMRVGEDPRVVVRDLASHIPLESFRLFAHSLLVHWETGGSLSSSLRTVGKTIRDRLEVSRRISAQAMESQVSVAAVMAITYGLTLLMWNANPGPIENLLSSRFGSVVAASLMILQAAGIQWIWRMSRIRF